MEKLILYHGSRGGIVGKIEPKNRLRCDFGAGLYMGILNAGVDLNASSRSRWKS